MSINIFYPMKLISNHLLFIVLFKVTFISSEWPTSDSSSINLLGLFQNSPSPSNSSPIALHAEAMFKAAILLSQRYNITIDGSTIGWKTANTEGDTITALNRTCEVLMQKKVVGIVGPTLSREASIIAKFAEKIGVPVVSYGATDPDLSNRKIYRNFYRTVPSDYAAATALAKLFLKYQWKSSIVIYQNDDFGEGGLRAIQSSFSLQNLTILQDVKVDLINRRSFDELQNVVKNSATRLIILWAETTYSMNIIRYAIKVDILGPHFTWIVVNGPSLDDFHVNFSSKLIGMFSIEPTIATIVNKPTNVSLLNEAYSLWKQYEPQTVPLMNQVDQYGLFAFDAAWLLIQSFDRYCSKFKNSSALCMKTKNVSHCFDYLLQENNKILNATTNTDFLGVSGPVKFSGQDNDRIDSGYYVINNVQLTGNSLEYVPVLKWSDDEWDAYTKQSVIIWPGSSLTPPTGYPRLTGTILKIGVIESNPFTMITNAIDESGQKLPKLIGYVPDLIELLQSRLEFTPEITLFPNNRTYADFINGVLIGNYDVVIGDVTITASRRKNVSFSNSIFDNSLRIIMRKDSAENVDLLSYLRPFSFSLWLLLCITSIYAGVLICIIERRENEALQDKSILSAVFMSLWYSIGTIMGYGVDFQARTAAGRLLTLGLYFLSLVLVATYTANLASDLTLAKSKDFLNSIEDVKNGKVPFHRIGVRIGTSTEEYYLREVSGGNRNYYPLRSRKEMFDSLLSGIIDVSFIDSGAGEYATNNLFCNLTLIGSDFDRGGFGIVTIKQWIYEHDLDVAVLYLRETGALDELKEKWFHTSICHSTQETTVTAAIETMSGLFLTFAVTSALSLILFAWKRRLLVRDFFLNIASRKIFSLPQEPSTLCRISKNPNV